MDINAEKFLADFAGLLEVDSSSINFDSELASLAAWDSVSFMGLISYSDSELDIVPDPDHVAACTTIGDLFTYLKSQLRSQAA